MLSFVSDHYIAILFSYFAASLLAGALFALVFGKVGR
jgi:hypothetical protein